jgi:protein involved in polysaccharide export with SLBB domain
LRLSGIILVLIFSLVLTDLYSQSIQPYRQKSEEEEEEKKPIAPSKVFDMDIRTQEKTTERLLPSQQLYEQSLDTQVDSMHYYLGPGDLLLVNIMGPLENQIITEVTSEGYVVLPGISDIRVAGLTLYEGSETIKKVLNQYFRDTRFTIRLMRMRKFRVYAVGEVNQPGTYFMRGADRLSDLIEIAEGISNGGDETRITIQHVEGNIDTVDVSDFYRNGIKEANPYLRGGDVVHFPLISLTRNYAFIEGNLKFPGIYQLKPNETLIEFLYRLKVFNRKSNVEDISITRRGETLPFNLFQNLEEAQNEVLQSGDRIFIPPNEIFVYVQGEVNQPGSYPYLANFTAKDYAGMAGMRETAQSIDKLYVVRSNTGEVSKGGDQIVYKGDVVVIPQRRRENTKDLLAIITPILSIALSTYAIILSSQK